MKKLTVITSYFWPFNITNGIVIGKKVFSLKDKFDIDIHAYDLTNILSVDETLLQKTKTMKVHYIKNTNFFLRRFMMFKSIFIESKDSNLLLSYHHLYETTYECFWIKCMAIFKKKKWVAILSDPPTFMSPFVSLSLVHKLREFFSSYIPYLLILYFSDKIVFNDIWQAKFILNNKYDKFSHKILINQMGFDLSTEDLKFSELDSSIENKKIKISYLGDLYGPRNGKEFFIALKKFLAEYEDYRELFTIDIYGNIEDRQIIKLIKNDFLLSEHINLYQRIDYNESIKKMLKSDILLVVDANLNDKTNIYPYTPSKIIDYISVKKPILGISMLNSPTHDICMDTKNWWSCFEIDEICKTFKHCIDNYQNHDYDEEIYYKYSIDNRNLEFFKMIEEIL